MHIWREGVLSKEKSTNGGKCLNLTQIFSRIITFYENLPRFTLLWDDSTIYLGEIYQLSTIGRFFFPSNVDCDLKICEYALHVVVEKVSAGSKQERKGEAEYHLKLGKWFLWKL